MFDKLNVAYKNYSQEIELAAQQVLVYSFWFSFYFTINSYFNCGRISLVGKVLEFTAAGLGFESWGRGTTQGLKQLRSVGTAFALQMAKPSCGSDTHIEWLSFLQKET